MAVENIVIKYVADTSGMAAGKRALQDVAHEEDNIRKSVEEATKSVREQGQAFKDVGDKASTGANQAAGGMLNLNNLMKSGAKLVAGYFAIDTLINFGRQILNVTAEFQKMGAVLKNTLGSQSAADNAMKMIADFAAKTPFSVRELTDSFIKLANRGMKPTADQMRQLGDLAASQGKSFDDLAEAMLDATTGEFERLKSFGINAKASGDEVAFTFKGVTTEVERTDTAIKAYIQSLGDAEGVSGSMAAISNTLSGKISNLGDNWDRLLLVLGEGSSGIMTAAVDDLNGFLSAVIKGSKAMDLLTDGTRSFGEIMDIIFSPGGITEALDKEWTGGVGRLGKATKETTPEVGLLIQKMNELKQAQDERDGATSRSGIASANIRIEKLKEEIQVLQQLGLTVPKNGIKPIDTREVQLANAELKVLNKELKEIEYSTNPANQDTNQREYFAGLLREWLEFNEAKVQIATEAAMQLGMLANTLFQNEIIENEERLAQLDEYYSREVELAGDNSRAKGELEQEYQIKRAEIEQEIAEQKRKQAIFNKAVNIAEATSETALAVIRALSDAGPFGGPAFAAAFAAIGAIQIATIAAQKIPKYKDGVLFLQGPGTETSDSINARLSVEESVIPGRQGRKYQPLLEDIYYDRVPAEVRAFYENGYQLPTMNTTVPEWAGSATNIDLSRVESRLDRLTSVVENLPIHQTYFDSNGVRNFIQQGNTRTEILNKMR